MYILLTILSLLVGIIILLLLVTIHEFAHFLTAKFFGAYVYEFAIGFGPKIIKWGKKETKYSIRLFPFGGYVYIASEFSDPPKDWEGKKILKKNKIENIKKWKRLIFIISGALINFFLSFFILTFSYAGFGYSPNDINSVGVKFLKNNSIYNFLYNDINYKNIINNNINNKNINFKYKFIDPVIINYSFSNNENFLNSFLLNNENKNNYEKNIDYEKNNFFVKKIVIGNIKKLPSYIDTINKLNKNLEKYFLKKEDNNKIYIYFDFLIFNRYEKKIIFPNNINNNLKNNNFFIYKSKIFEINKKDLNSNLSFLPPVKVFSSFKEGYIYGFKKTFDIIKIIFKSIGFIFTGQFSKISGPFGIAKELSFILKNGFFIFLIYISIISLNLFVWNLLFIPPLDGYKFFEIFIEIIVNIFLNFKKRFKINSNKKNNSFNYNQNWSLPYKFKIIVNIIGLSLFFIIFLITTIKDLFF